MSDGTQKENTRKLLDQVYGITSENSMRVWLDSKTRTLPIIDEFYKSAVKILIIASEFCYTPYGMVSLIISKSSPNIDMIPSLLTITDLKKSSGCFIKADEIERRDGARFCGLSKQIFDVITKNSKSRDYIPLNIPYQFNAQRSVNRSGYGSRYCGTSLIHEGTLYGETTTFVIIGIVLE